MKTCTSLAALLAASLASAGIVRIGPFDGRFDRHYEDWNFLDNPSRFGGPFQVESGPNAIYGFDNSHLHLARPLRPSPGDPCAH